MHLHVHCSSISCTHVYACLSRSCVYLYFLSCFVPENIKYNNTSKITMGQCKWYSSFCHCHQSSPCTSTCIICCWIFCLYVPVGSKYIWGRFYLATNSARPCTCVHFIWEIVLDCYKPGEIMGNLNLKILFFTNFSLSCVVKSIPVWQQHYYVHVHVALIERQAFHFFFLFFHFEGSRQVDWCTVGFKWRLTYLWIATCIISPGTFTVIVIVNSISLVICCWQSH